MDRGGGRGWGLLIITSVIVCVCISQILVKKQVCRMSIVHLEVVQPAFWETGAQGGTSLSQSM